SIDPTSSAAVPSPGRQRGASPRRQRRAGAQAYIGYTFSSGYVLLLLAFGIGPMLYALYLAFTKGGAFVGLDNFAKVFGDFRFFPAVQHVALFVVIWLVALLVLVTALAVI